MIPLWGKKNQATVSWKCLYCRDVAATNNTCLPPLFKDLLQSCVCKLGLHVLWLCPPPQARAVGYHSFVCLRSTPCERAVPTLWARGEWWENTCGAVGITVLLGVGVERVWQRGQAVLTQV